MDEAAGKEKVKPASASVFVCLFQFQPIPGRHIFQLRQQIRIPVYRENNAHKQEIHDGTVQAVG